MDWVESVEVSGEGDRWEYVPAAARKVIVQARDLAGNVVKE